MSGPSPALRVSARGSDHRQQAQPLPKPTVIVFGSAAIDITSSSPTALAPRTTTPGAIHLTPGGVGRNIAEAAHKLLSPCAVQLVSLVGSEGQAAAASSSSATDLSVADGFGHVLMQEMAVAGMRVDGLTVAAGHRTAACSLTLESDADLVAGVADMGIIETLSAEQVRIRRQRHFEARSRGR